MNRRTRIFFFVTLGILVLGLSAGAIASYMGGFQNLTRIGVNGPSELEYVPRNAVMLAYVDVRGVMHSNLRQALERFNGPSSGAAQGQFEAATGVNVQRDVDHAVVFSTQMPPNAPPMPPTVVLRGRFDAAHIESLLRSQGATVEEYRGARLLNHASVQMGVAFAEPGLLVAGTPAAVRAALDARNGRAAAGVRGNPEFMRLIRDVDNGTVWAVADYDEVTGQFPLPPGFAEQIPALSWVAISGRVDDGIHGRIRVEARDEAGAKQLRGIVQSFLTLVKLQGNGHAGMSQAIESLQLSGQGNTVLLDFSVPPTMLDAMGPSAHPRGAMPTPRPATPQP